MVLAQAEYLDVFDDDQFVVIFMKYSAVDDIPQIFLVALREEHHCFGVTLRRAV